ncbi:MAG TPA: ABC transporter ATP-binding protein [Candidatus Nanoarchaeia archaeon]|nr:ABC transporter ATP-binding protein [Candidatus Nanoarchaeia archaeon]
MRGKRGEKINFKENFKTFWESLKGHRLLFFLVLIVAFIVEALFVIDKFLFKEIIDKGSLFINGELGQGPFIDILVIIAGVFLGVVLIRSLGNWLKIHLLVKLDSNLIYNIKKKFFNHILGLSHNFHTNHKTGSLISRLTRGSQAIERMSDILLFSITPLFFNLIIVGVSLASMSTTPLIVLVCVVAVFLTYSFIILEKQQKDSIKHNKTQDREKALVSDVFSNVDTIKYFGQDNRIKSFFKRAATNVRRKKIKAENHYRWFDGGQSLIIGIGTFLLIYFPIKEFLAGEITIGTVVFIYTVYGNVVRPMFNFVHGARGFYKSMADVQELFKYEEIENEIKDKKGAKNLKVEKGNIEFKNVDFSYGKNKNKNKKNQKVFEDFNLKIKPNEKIALVGRSGCGKTTLIKLLNRFYDVDSGQILIDGKDIRNYKKKSVRSEIGTVPQEGILFDDTIYNNIKFANPSASPQEVKKAIKFAQLDRIIEKLPNKEKTIVGERGVKLSGGERQRVSIARALLANRKILVLDEATSSLDSETEHEIQKDLEKLLKGRTSIIIAHRLSTIMNADRIIVMREGEIVQQGTHRDLITEGGEYQRLWNFQKGGYIE